MKKSIKAMLAVLVMAFMLVPAVKAQAAVAPAAPTGLGLSQQQGNKFQLMWDYDSNILYCGYNYNFGFQVTVKTLKNKTIAVLDKNSIDNAYESEVFGISTAYNKVYVVLSNKNMGNQAFKFSVVPYVYDELGNRVYGASSAEKIIVPRATTKKAKLAGSGRVKVSWKKIKGAKSYVVYLTSNNGSSWKKKGTTKGTSLVLRNLKKYQNYAVYVEAKGIKNKKKKLNSTKPLFKSSNSGTPFYIYTVYR
jgi:hypothetical protein